MEVARSESKYTMDQENLKPTLDLTECRRMVNANIGSQFRILQMNKQILTKNVSTMLRMICRQK